jgi:hypothetical protein
MMKSCLPGLNLFADLLLCLLKTPNACDSRGLEMLEGFQLVGRWNGRLNRHALAWKPSGTC